jgi:hypothetical protein
VDQDATSAKRTSLVGDGPTPRDRLRLAHTAPHADFISQLIAERQYLPPQRARRRAPVGEALAAYDSGAHIADRRIPPGYRKTIVT